ncbi:MAG TPA: nicotinate-nucleotide adenylyltransferase [Kiritimatiellia bacterium]|nr:nicotinate-nucleotide adenylyltransferase [Kiritimatiellia bacterium]HMO98308.1 nicotinate-nucleotide adenylyltransferase [Kiritimatiellia bacterium]HMP95496.1 nicotinate-nucleotide adenylyltransferase [Kiritimatiellia bacterium]
MRRKKFAIFGGSFNPIHLGHLIMAQDAAGAYGLDRIYFVPAACPPHKPSGSLITPQHRLEMVGLALAGRTDWLVSDVEIRRGGISYSIDTVRYFSDLHPDAEWYFIIGGDTLPELHTWKEINSLLRECRFITVVRPGFESEGLSAQALRLPAELVNDVMSRLVVGHAIGISSTDIRMRIANREPIRYLVAESVEAYIHEHSIYPL